MLDLAPNRNGKPTIEYGLVLSGDGVSPRGEFHLLTTCVTPTQVLKRLFANDSGLAGVCANEGKRGAVNGGGRSRKVTSGVS